jgi:uncharacterized membrane protein YdfJ with MMPL/SSD domain
MKHRQSAQPQVRDPRWAVTHRQAAITVPVAVAALLLLAALTLAQGGYDQRRLALLRPSPEQNEVHTHRHTPRWHVE